MQWRQITIIGVGLLGGSLAMAARQRQLARQIVGFARRPETVKACQQLGVFDRMELELGPAVSGTELVVLCTPIGQMTGLVKRMAPWLKSEMLVTDVGSVKGAVIDSLEPLINPTGARFIGGHPMAGSDKAGVEAAHPDLFDNATCAITPTPRSAPLDVKRLADFWRGVGARSLVLSAELHDQLVGRCSHLPHLLAASLVNSVLQENRPAEQAQLCGPGFRDTTRVASGSPGMWGDICRANQSNLVPQLGELIESLTRLRSQLESGQYADLERFLAEAQERRNDWARQFPGPSESPP